MDKMRMVGLKVVNSWHLDDHNLDEEREATDAGSCCACQLSLCLFVIMSLRLKLAFEKVSHMCILCATCSSTLLK